MNKIDEVIKCLNKANDFLAKAKNIEFEQINSNYFDGLIYQNNAVIYALNKSKPDIENLYEFLSLVDVLHVSLTKEKSDKVYKLIVTCRIYGVIDRVETIISFQKAKELRDYLRLNRPTIQVWVNQG